jgi:TrmH family RNA methyltransferase
VEGYDELSLALDTGARMVTLYVCPPLFREPAGSTLLDRLSRSGSQVIEVSEKVFRRIAYRENPDGWLATFPSRDRPVNALKAGADALLLVAESVEKPGNLGAMLRTGDAAGIHALIAADPIGDWGNPNLVRSSKGALFSVPVASGTSNETLAWLSENRISVVAAAPDGEMPYTSTDMSGPVAVAVGSEKRGLSKIWLERANVRVRIPMVGRVNSLNVATSASLLIYEAVRQRSGMHTTLPRWKEGAGPGCGASF